MPLCSVRRSSQKSIGVGVKIRVTSSNQSPLFRLDLVEG
jgi:hypothetical protein